MKQLLVILLLAFAINVHSQVAINTDGTSPDNSAMLDVKSSHLLWQKWQDRQNF
jgi:hypothetical protein